jgi:hypothetical protein
VNGSRALLPRDTLGSVARPPCVRRRLLERGSHHLTQVRLPRGLFLRTTLIHPRTTLDDLRTLLERLRQAAQQAGTARR